MHVLQLCPRVPYPPHDGGAIAMYETVRGLAEAGHRVTVLAANTPKHHQPADVLAHLGPNVQLITVDVDTRLRPLAALWNLMISRKPYAITRFIDSSLSGRLAELVLAEQFDVIQYEGTFVAWYNEWLDSEGLTPASAVSVLRAHNVEYTIWEALSKRERNPLKKLYLSDMAVRLRRFEQEYLKYFDAIAAITQQDADRLQALFKRSDAPGWLRNMNCPEPIAVIPASFDLSRLAPAVAPPQPRTVFIIGSLNWLPNLEGLAWFLREVWPLAHTELPDLELHVAGSHPPAHLTQRPAGQDNVFVHGFVDSAPAFMQQYELMLVPLLSGGGMRVKVVEGLALGKPILSTALGAEGVAAHDGENILLRDTPAAWLATLRDYYHGRLPLAELGRAAARTAHDEYDTRQVTKRLLNLYRAVGAGLIPVAAPSA